MKIKESEQLMLLASESGKTANEVSEILITESINRGIIEDTNDNWGLTIDECVDGTTPLTAVVDVLIAAGIPNKSRYFDAFCQLVVIGNGDCPECGGEYEVTDGDYKQTGGFYYDSEPEYTPIWEEKKCTHCGHKESNEP